jgi:hypothetical protein
MAMISIQLKTNELAAYLLPSSSAAAVQKSAKRRIIVRRHSFRHYSRPTTPPCTR